MKKKRSTLKFWENVRHLGQKIVADYCQKNRLTLLTKNHPTLLRIKNRRNLTKISEKIERFSATLFGAFDAIL